MDAHDHDTGRIVVFRPKRRCPRCGLINVDTATRCRRCRESFASIDPAAESERLVARMRRRRAIVAVVAAAIVAGLVAAGYGLYDRFNESARYASEFRKIAADVRSVELGARSDATVLFEAIDDVELRSTLEDQKVVWEDRLGTCTKLRERLERLVPPTTDAAREQMRTSETLSTVASVSTEIVRAAREGDAKAAREAASRLAEEPLATRSNQNSDGCVTSESGSIGSMSRSRIRRAAESGEWPS